METRKQLILKKAAATPSKSLNRWGMGRDSEVEGSRFHGDDAETAGVCGGGGTEAEPAGTRKQT